MQEYVKRESWKISGKLQVIKAGTDKSEKINLRRHKINTEISRQTSVNVGKLTKRKAPTKVL